MRTFKEKLKKKDFKRSDTLPEEASVCAGCCGGVSGSRTDWQTCSAGQKEETPKEEGFNFGSVLLFNILTIKICV